MAKVLVVSFDGLDYELIKEFKLDNIPQKEFGYINNYKDINVVVTSELFASFITGKTFEEHGVIGVAKYNSSLLNRIESLNRFKFFRKFTGLRRKLYGALPFDSHKRKVTHKDLQASTLFDKIPQSYDIGVRSYSVGYHLGVMPVFRKYGLEAAEETLTRFKRWKRWELFDSMKKEYNFVMAHFHDVDYIHHWYWEVGKMDKVEETYHEMDEFAGEILEKAKENGFDTVIFMSDHGLPDVENGGHNENAFYSCNHELFRDKTPHITDFHDKILELVDQHKEELEGVDL